MDATERRRLLFEKVIANNQRRKREELLSRLPPDLSHVLGGSPCIYSVEIDSVLRRFVPFNRSGVGSSGFMPPNYDYVEVGWENKMLALLPRVVVPHLAGQGFLMLDAPAGVYFEGHLYYLPDVPVFLVEFRWAVALLTELWSYCIGGLFLVERDLRAGVLIDKYCGILPEDPNPSEIAYEVALWPVQPDEVGD